MAHLGSATIQPIPTITAAATAAYTPTQGMHLDTATLFTFGGTSEPVTPKRYLNVGGVWVPIQ
jgi:hypothetical protein